MRMEKFDPSKPEMLAAYIDGEFEGCPTLAAQKRAIEQWIDRHQEVCVDLAAWRRLKQLWQIAAPPEPDEESWQRLRTGIDEGLRRENVGNQRRAIPWGWLAGGAAAAIFLAAVLGFGSRWLTPTVAPEVVNGPDDIANKQAPAELLDAFPVATADEIEILRVAGDDTPALNVAYLPFDGPMQLAETEDVSDVDMQTAKNELRPQMVTQSSRPMIWGGGGLGE